MKQPAFVFLQSQVINNFIFCRPVKARGCSTRTVVIDCEGCSLNDCFTLILLDGKKWTKTETETILISVKNILPSKNLTIDLKKAM